MNLSTLHRTFRTAFVVTMLLGWLTLSQRCAIAQILRAQQAAAVQHECCDKDRPQPDGAPQNGRPAECCQRLGVLLPDGVKAPGEALSDSVRLPIAWVDAEMEFRPALRCSEAEPDPPSDLLAFPELVLHRSLCAHAPPVPA